MENHELNIPRLLEHPVSFVHVVLNFPIIVSERPVRHSSDSSGLNPSRCNSRWTSSSRASPTVPVDEQRRRIGEKLRERKCERSGGERGEEREREGRYRVRVRISLHAHFYECEEWVKSPRTRDGNLKGFAGQETRSTNFLDALRWSIDADFCLERTYFHWGKGKKKERKERERQREKGEKRGKGGEERIEKRRIAMG